MAEIYIVFVSTPGVFASIIRKVLKQKYVHVAISLDEQLEECYSIGRRNPEVPLLAGFEKEEKNRILRKFPNAEYAVCKIECTAQQKRQVKERLECAMKHRYQYHYTILGLPLILMEIPFRQKTHYTCSSFIAKLLECCEIWKWEKHTSIVTPKDFWFHGGKKIVFEGRLEDIVYDREEERYKTQFLYG